MIAKKIATSSDLSLIHSFTLHMWGKNCTVLFLGRPRLVGKALSFTHELSFFSFFYQSTALSSRAVYGHQMYVKGSVVGKASTIGI